MEILVMLLSFVLGVIGAILAPVLRGLSLAKGLICRATGLSHDFEEMCRDCCESSILISSSCRHCSARVVNLYSGSRHEETYYDEEGEIILKRVD